MDGFGELGVLGLVVVVALLASVVGGLTGAWLADKAFRFRRAWLHADEAERLERVWNMKHPDEHDARAA